MGVPVGGLYGAAGLGDLTTTAGLLLEPDLGEGPAAGAGDAVLLLGLPPAGDQAGLGDLTTTAGLLLGLALGELPAMLQVTGRTSNPLNTACPTTPLTWRLRLPSATSITKATVVAVCGAVLLAMEKLLSSVTPSATSSSWREQAALLVQSISASISDTL